MKVGSLIMQYAPSSWLAQNNVSNVQAFRARRGWRRYIPRQDAECPREGVRPYLCRQALKGDQPLRAPAKELPLV